MNRDDASTSISTRKLRNALLFLALVLAPSRFTRGSCSCLCLCLWLRRTCKPAFTLRVLLFAGNPAGLVADRARHGRTRSVPRGGDVLGADTVPGAQGPAHQNSTSTQNRPPTPPKTLTHQQNVHSERHERTSN